MLLDASAAAAAAPELPAVAVAGLGLRVFTTRRLTVPGFPFVVVPAAAFDEADAVRAEVSAVVGLAARGVAPATRDLPEGDLTPCCLDPARFVNVPSSEFGLLFFLFFLRRNSRASSSSDSEMPAAPNKANRLFGDMVNPSHNASFKPSDCRSSACSTTARQAKFERRRQFTAKSSQAGRQLGSRRKVATQCRHGDTEQPTGLAQHCFQRLKRAKALQLSYMLSSFPSPSLAHTEAVVASIIHVYCLRTIVDQVMLGC